MTFKLHHDDLPASVTLDEALESRRTHRNFSDSPVSLTQLSRLVWAAQGVTGDAGQKTAPSAGAQYPLQVYVIAGAIEGLPAGSYEYNGETHSLSNTGGDVRKELGDAVLDDQPWVVESAAIIIVTADFAAAQTHFHEQPPQGERGSRYVYIETGAVAQNVQLQATNLGLGVVLVGGFDDVKVKNALRLPLNLEPTALLCIGVIS